MQKTITLYYDCLSPFSFLAFKVLQRYTAVGGAWSHLANVQLKPVLMAGIMASYVTCLCMPCACCSHCPSHPSSSFAHPGHPPLLWPVGVCSTLPRPPSTGLHLVGYPVTICTTFCT
jgi:hypothetical protein